MASFKLSFHDLTKERDRLLKTLPSGSASDTTRITTGELLPFSSFTRCAYWGIAVFVEHRLRKNSEASAHLWGKLGSLLTQMTSKLQEQLGESIVLHDDFKQITQMINMVQAKSTPPDQMVKILTYKGVNTTASYLMTNHGLPKSVADKLDACKSDTVDLENKTGLLSMDFTAADIEAIEASLTQSIE